MLILLKENLKITLKEVANLLNYGDKTIKTYWKNYKKKRLININLETLKQLGINLLDKLNQEN